MSLLRVPLELFGVVIVKLVLLIGFIAIVTKAQVCDIKGDWTGKLSVYGNEIPLVFHFDGEKCTIDSPDQGAKGIPAQLERTAMGIKVAVPSINANYEGVNIGDSVMGTFKQHGQSFPLTLKPGSVKLMLAAEGKVDFVVSLAGGVVSFEKTLLEQNRWTLQKTGYSRDVIDRYCTALESLFDDLKAGRNPETTNHGLPTELEKNLQIAKVQSSTPYMRYFLALDLTDRLGKITCPVLALNGTKDRQVNSEENLNALMDRLAGQKEIKAIEGLNHMFQHCNTGDPSEYKDIEETFAPEALEVITTWLKMFK